MKTMEETFAMARQIVAEMPAWKKGSPVNQRELPKPWARMRLHGPCKVLGWHETREQAEMAIQTVSAAGGVPESLQCVAYFPHKEFE